MPFRKNTGEELTDSFGTYLSWIPTLRTDPPTPLGQGNERYVKRRLMHKDICWCGLSGAWGNPMSWHPGGLPAEDRKSNNKETPAPPGPGWARGDRFTRTDFLRNGLDPQHHEGSCGQSTYRAVRLAV